jgi:S1-C subfamily serine protease
MMIGDVLVDWNGAPVGRPEALRPALTEAVGKSVPIRILRGGELADLSVEIEPRKRSR